MYSNNQEFEMTRPGDNFSNIPSETKVVFLVNMTVRFTVEIFTV